MALRGAVAGHFGCLVRNLASCRRPFATTPLAKYKALVQSKQADHDPGQLAVMKQLDVLHDSIVSLDRRGGPPALSAGPTPPPPTALASLFSFGGLGARREAAPAPAPVAVPQGRYIWGGVGSGKTWLMDMFVDSLPIRRKRRVHFNAFMLDVHARLHRMRQDGAGGAGQVDPLLTIASDLLREAYVLAFDEFQVTDVGDAMIMARLFGAMFRGGLVMVATSNRPPDDLYRDGLNRHLFLPTIDSIKAHCAVLHLSSPTDYRLLGTQLGQAWITTGGTPALQASFNTVSKGESPRATTLSTQGRAVTVRRAALDAGVAWFTFHELCAQPLGAADFIVIAQNFRVVYVADVPKLSMQERGEVRRFITLVDTLYEHKVKLFACAPLPPQHIFQPGGHAEGLTPTGPASRHVVGDEDAWGGADEVFAFDRTVSRLIEMQSAEYMAAQWLPHLHAPGRAP